MLSFLYEIDIFAGSTQFYSIAVILNIARIVKTVLPQVTVCLICLVCLCLEHLNPRYLLTMPLSQSVTSRLETSWYRDFSHFLPTPTAGGQEKSFAEQMFFLGLRPGGWAFNFWHLFRFSMCYPKGAHSWHHRWGQFATKKGYFNFSMCYPKGAHSLGHRLGQWVTKVGYFNFSLCFPKGAHSLGHRWGHCATK